MARKLIVEITGDSSGLERAYKRSSDAGRKFSSDLEHTGRGIAVAQVGFRGLGRSLAFASGGFIAGAGISLAVKNIVSSASDLNEEVNKSNVVFGKSASSIQAWSKTTADASGIARAAALEAAGGFGSILETSGLTEKASAGMSKSLVNLAGDIASFNNIDPNEALEKLRSGLVGEAEPLRTVGVLLSESRVKAEAYRSGIAKQGAVLTDAQKVQARYNIILADTTRQQGDFARTSDGLANATRRVKAGITDIAASLGSAILPTLAKATSGFADFLGDFQKARGVRAKLNVVLDAGESIGRAAANFVRDLYARIGEAVQGTDFGRVAQTILERIGAALNAINWAEVGRIVGTALITALNAVREFVAGVNWGDVGRSVIRGIARGLVAFIRGTDWVGLFKALIRTWLAVIKGLYSLLYGAGVELLKQLGLGIKAGLSAIGRVLEIQSLKIALAILKPLNFTILGRHIIPGLNDLVTSIETKLDALATSAEKSADRVNTAVRDIAEHGRGTATTPTPTPTPTPTVTTPTPDVTDITPKVKDTTTKLERAQKAFSKLMDALNLKAERAATTRGLNDDIRAQQAINAAIVKEIGVEGRTTDLARQLFEGRQKLADLARQQVQQRQFLALGLTAEGGERAPSRGTLQRRLGSLREAIKGTVLDTAKTRSELQRIAKVLSGAFGKVGADVRQAIKGMLDDIAGGLQGGSSAEAGPLTTFAKRGVEGLTKGLGLTAEQVKEIRQRFSQFGAADFSPALAGGGRVDTVRRDRAAPRAEDRPIVVHVFLDGHEVEATVTRRQQKKRGRNNPQRRGTRAGR